MKEKKTGLEDFVERHRADFDAFEPRPDLWDAIEQELSATPRAEAPAEEAPLRLVKLQPAEELPAQPLTISAPPRRPNYGVAAAIALLILAGIGAIWSKSAPTMTWTRLTSAPLALSSTEGEDATEPATFGASTVGIEAASPQKRLAVAVQRMEDYYATQIGEKKQEIGRLQAPAATPGADWSQELATLDSTYAQLKVELYRNPEPDVVLEAMNRNMQIRLDILNQQVRLQERMKEYGTATPQKP
ncbi:hypothetical protein E5K00_17080 [Hymenobacter aquaticus]|uniref:Anti-sigma factor n=1 Tax=Hymenobacter aquaticus TaxID=1867101 RepID=A0A4Z0PW19_9BACT|nr:hypothetical protein [Hymenobacter aquaticus]TGE21970.1 hypothetical protein E5K00_17080 [Hymenobacter aquaticus]